jgi:hypothetical protein
LFVLSVGMKATRYNGTVPVVEAGRQ